MIPLGVIVLHKVLNGRSREASPKKIIRSRQGSLMLRTNGSACAFKLGEHSGSFTDFTPADSSV